MAAINQHRTLAVGGSSVVLDILLGVIGLGHDGFLEASKGSLSITLVELRLAGGEVNLL